MAKKATELSDLHIRRLKHHVTASGEPRAKRYPVGGVSGLYIQCSPPSGSNRVGSKQWILRTLVGDKRRDIGLGGLKDLPLKDARETAKAIKRDIKAGTEDKCGVP
ncbi:TPA: DUF4102 domain-containing protein [Candidatus Poribacteria bacterium]|nr:DUF4102 domain-containing protein [Candidatus Poribacteria bacterium]